MTLVSKPELVYSVLSHLGMLLLRRDPRRHRRSEPLELRPTLLLLRTRRLELLLPRPCVDRQSTEEGRQVRRERDVRCDVP